MLRSNFTNLEPDNFNAHDKKTGRMDRYVWSEAF